MARTYGVAGRMAAAFIHSKLTSLFILASMALGALAVVALPREEEPQIIVPMVDVFVEMPGATPADVEQRVTRPMEQLLWEVPGVEYVYSTSSPGQSMVVVRFKVDEPQEAALVRLNQKLAANADRIPPGVIGPIVKPRSIDDVPILAVTVWSSRYADDDLRSLAVQLRDAIAEVNDVSEVTIIGGRPRQVRVDIDPARLAAYDLDPLSVRQAIARTNVRGTASGPVAGGVTTGLEAGSRLRTAEELRNTVVTSANGRPVLVRDVADVVDGDAEPSSYVTFRSKTSGAQPAVTISVAKRKGTNATDVARRVAGKLDTLKGSLVPSDVHLTVTRDYGETAADKSNELLWHMLLSVLSVSALIWLVLGRREAAVVLIAIPVTLALTLFMFYLYGYTLNRITLFALIFSIGILVDDAIVVVENIVRQARMSREERGRGGLTAIAIRAVDEVGNPTILATLAVVAAILPMAFVRGLSGPYLRPIPVGASAAMVFSLVVAFVVTPWAAVRLLKPSAHHDHGGEDLLTRLYRRVMGPLIVSGRASGRRRAIFLAGVAALLLAAVALVPLELVSMKMMPFDNKSEFQVMIDMPEGTALETTARVASALASATLDDETVVNVQQYVGVSAPYNFNGLVRHYFLRRAPHLADLQVNLVPKGERSAQSHEVAGRVRERLIPIAKEFRATIQVAEVPPGPPVLQTLVAEVYGPDPARRMAVAAQIKSIFEQTPGVVDTDWYVEAPHAKITLAVDGEKAAAAGLSPAAVAAVVRMAGSGESAGLLHDERAREDVPIVIRLPRDGRSLEAVQSIRLRWEVGSGHQAGCRGRAHERRDHAGRAKPVSQESAGGDLRHRRPGRREGEPGLRHPPDEHADRAAVAARGLWARGLQRGPAVRHLALRDEVGRRVAPHDRGVPRPRPRFRGRARAHLRAGGRLVPVVQDAPADHGPHPVLAHWHPAGARGDGRVLHGHVDDRLHRRCGHRGAQFDHPGGLHRTAVARGASPRAGRRRRRRGAVPSHGPHRRRHDRRRRGHPVRPDFPGPGDFADGRRGGVAPALAHGRARPLLHGEAPRA